MAPVPTVMRELLEARSAYFADVECAVTGSAEPRLLVRSDLSGTMQLYELVGGELVEQTALADPVGAAHYVPGTRLAVLQVDATGDEHHQLYLLDLDATVRPAVERGQLDALTASPEFGHHLAGVSPDGTTVAYLSNGRNGVDFDLWVCDLGTREHRALYTDGGWCMPSSGFSPDGRYVAVARPGPRPLDFDLLLVEVRTGEQRVLLPHPDEAAEVHSPAWVSAGTCFVSSNVGRDRAAVVRCDLSSGETVLLPGSGDGAAWDAVPYTSSDGKTLLVVENRNGASAMRLFDARDLRDLGEVEIAEPGVVDPYVAAPPKFHPDGTRVFHSLTTPRRAADVWVTAAVPRQHADCPAPRRLTDSPAPVPPGNLSTLETAEVTAFDGETIPLFFFVPASSAAGEARAGRKPVVVIVHGGPEAQATQMFNPVAQALASSGYGVVVPNVRGSTGYGKRYAGLDDRTRRLDSVRDLASVHAWLEGAGFDPERAALWGGSYGGYMVLAGLAFQPELWAAGVDIVGISDLVTFLEHTADYRRAHREREYGSLIDDREFLERASPLRSADRIRAPLFVIHGRNDPRVPVGEAEQLVARLAARGVRCELEIYEDEGHGLARLPNRIDAYTKALAFLDSVLVPVSA
jgi:dipeptidyl aminopeptidase/acylaminoacyl peptidase